MTREKLTPAEAGRLGGLTAAHHLGVEGAARRASKGGVATLEKHGKAHFARAALVRWGRLESKEKGQRPRNAGPKRSVDDADTPSPAA